MPKAITVKKKLEIDTQFVKMIVKGYRPFDMAEDEEFKKFVALVNPNYSIPCRKTVSSSLIPQLYNQNKEIIIEELKSAFAVSVTTDSWTSVNAESFLAYTAHFISEKLTMKSYLLDCLEFTERHTAVNLSKETKRILNEYGLLEKVTTVVTDNAANIVLMTNNCGFRHLPCFAHTINLVLQNSLKEIGTTIRKVKLIVEHFKRSPHATKKLLQIQKQMGRQEKKLKQDVVTRWNSTFYMLSRFLEEKEPVLSVLGILGTNLDIPNSNDWVIIEESSNILNIFEEITTEISAEKSVSVSKIVIFIDIMKKHVEQIIENGEHLDKPLEMKRLAEKLLEQMKIRFKVYEDNIICLEATLLDPRFKKYGFVNEALYTKAYDSLVSLATQYYSDIINVTEETEQSKVNECNNKNQNKKSSSIWSFLDEKVNSVANEHSPVASAIIEIDRYLREPYLNRCNDALQWWMTKRDVFPALFQVVKKRLCIPATSVPSERIFSKAGQILSNRRRNISSTKLQQVVFLNHNM